MSPIALQTAELAHAPKLRLLPSKHSAYATSTAAGAFAPAAHLETTERRASPTLLEDAPQHERPVLIAGRDPHRRAAVLRDLVESMPRETAFEETGAFWEVLAQAPSISMVILSGELDDMPAESLLATLAHRRPDLPVVSLDAQTTSLDVRACLA